MTDPRPHRRAEVDLRRWYGDWEPLTPATVGTVMGGFDRPWWVIAGWALETFTGVARSHDDLDVSVLSCDLGVFRDHLLAGGWTPWNVDDSWFRPWDDRFTEVHPESQAWVRRDAASPWVLDVPFTLATPGPDGEPLWTHKRDHAVVAPLDDVTWVADDGLRYLRPEVALSIKARGDRPKDRADLEAAVPLLDDDARTWLRTFLARVHPGHPWLEVLARAADR